MYSRPQHPASSGYEMPLMGISIPCASTNGRGSLCQECVAAALPPGSRGRDPDDVPTPLGRGPEEPRVESPAPRRRRTPATARPAATRRRRRGCTPAPSSTIRPADRCRVAAAPRDRSRSRRTAPRSRARRRRRPARRRRASPSTSAPGVGSIAERRSRWVIGPSGQAERLEHLAHREDGVHAWSTFHVATVTWCVRIASFRAPGGSTTVLALARASMREAIARPVAGFLPQSP